VESADRKERNSMTSRKERSVEEAARSEERHDSRDDLKSYVRFGAMIATAMVAMYVTTYVNTFTPSHVKWSGTRVFPWLTRR
jgi:hypothetical protein